MRYQELILLISGISGLKTLQEGADNQFGEVDDSQNQESTTVEVDDNRIQQEENDFIKPFIELNNQAKLFEQMSLDNAEDQHGQQAMPEKKVEMKNDVMKKVNATELSHSVVQKMKLKQLQSHQEKLFDVMNKKGITQTTKNVSQKKNLLEQSVNLLNEAKQLPVRKITSKDIKVKRQLPQQVVSVTNNTKPIQETAEEKYAKQLTDTFKQLADQEKMQKLQQDAQKPDFGQNLYDKSQELLKSATELASGTTPEEPSKSVAQTSGTNSTMTQAQSAELKDEISKKIMQALHQKDADSEATKEKEQEVKQIASAISGSLQAKTGQALVENKMSETEQRSHDFLEKLKSFGEKYKPTYALNGLKSLAETQKQVNLNLSVPVTSTPSLSFTTTGDLKTNIYETNIGGPAQASLKGELFDTHNEIVKLQDSLIAMKQNKLQKLQQMSAMSDVGLVDLTPADDSFVHLKRRHHHHHHHYNPLTLVQTSAYDTQNKTHAILYKGAVKIVPDHQIQHLDKNTLAKPYIFAILSLDKEDKSSFKSKTYNRTHLAEMYQTFEDVTQIRKDPHVIMVGNGKLIKHTGSIESDEVQALIGRAIQKKFLSVKFNQNLAQSESKNVKIVKLTEQDGQLQTKFESKSKESLKKAAQVPAKKHEGKKKKDENPAYNQAECKDVQHPQAEMTLDGKVIEACFNKNVKEWQSFALIGKYASQSPDNTARQNYLSDHPTEKDIGLEIKV